jgi:hypothetical protein
MTLNRSIGLWMATAPVGGSTTGAGVFPLPATRVGGPHAI